MQQKTIAIDETLLARARDITGLAEDSALVNEALQALVARERAREDFRQETLAAWEHYRETGRSVPGEAVKAWLDSWGTAEELPAPRG